VDIAFNCDTCAQRIVIDEAGAGLTVACPTCGANLIVPNVVSPKAKAKKTKRAWTRKTRQKRLIHWVERAARLCGHGGGSIFSDVFEGLRTHAGEADSSERVFIEEVASYFERRRQASFYAGSLGGRKSVPEPEFSKRLWALADVLRTRFGISEDELTRVWKD
jgi:hypothetical protein